MQDSPPVSQLNPPQPSAELPAFSARIGRVLDNTALKDYMTCPTKYFFGMHLDRRKDTTTIPLNYGTCWHAALDASYKSPECHTDDLMDKVALAATDAWRLPPGDDHRTLNRLLLEYTKYIKRWGLPWEEPEYKTLGWPDAPFVELAVEQPIPLARHPYAGKLDRIAVSRVGQSYIVEDHKTTSQMRSDYFKQWAIDNQMIGYAALAQRLTGKPISGVRINLHVIHKTDSIFERQLILFSQPRIESWFRLYDVWLERLETSIERYEEALSLYQREGWSPAYDRLLLTAWPQNFTACAGRFGMCGYSDVCTMPPNLRMAHLEQYFGVLPWDPLHMEDATDA